MKIFELNWIPPATCTGPEGSAPGKNFHVLRSAPTLGFKLPRPKYAFFEKTVFLVKIDIFGGFEPRRAVSGAPGSIPSRFPKFGFGPIFSPC